MFDTLVFIATYNAVRDRAWDRILPSSGLLMQIGNAMVVGMVAKDTKDIPSRAEGSHHGCSGN